MNEVSDAFGASSFCSECRERNRNAEKASLAEATYTSMLDAYAESMGVRAGGKEHAIFKAVAHAITEHHYREKG